MRRRTAKAAARDHPCRKSVSYLARYSFVGILSRGRETPTAACPHTARHAKLNERGDTIGPIDPARPAANPAERRTGFTESGAAEMERLSVTDRIGALGDCPSGRVSAGATVSGLDAPPRRLAHVADAVSGPDPPPDAADPVCGPDLANNLDHARNDMAIAVLSAGNHRPVSVCVAGDRNCHPFDHEHRAAANRALCRVDLGHTVDPEPDRRYAGAAGQLRTAYLGTRGFRCG